MDKAEARRILRDLLDELELRPHAELVALIGAPDVRQVVGASGTQYQVEIEAFWDSTPNGDVRVMGSIDDGGWRSFVPLTDSFIGRKNG